MRHMVAVPGGVDYPETLIDGRKVTCVLLLNTSCAVLKRDPHNSLMSEIYHTKFGAR